MVDYIFRADNCSWLCGSVNVALILSSCVKYLLGLDPTNNLFRERKLNAVVISHYCNTTVAGWRQSTPKNPQAQTLGTYSNGISSCCIHRNVSIEKILIHRWMNGITCRLLFHAETLHLSWTATSLPGYDDDHKDGNVNFQTEVTVRKTEYKIIQLVNVSIYK